MEVLIHF
jgi:hypothetical protein